MNLIKESFMKKLISSWKSYRHKLILVLPPAVLVIFNIFFFGPATIYSGNVSEFDISLLTLLKYYAVPSIILLLVFLGIGRLLSKRFLCLYVSLLLTVGILLWVQGNILVWDYGVFGKGDINWSKDTWRGWVDGSLWAVLLISACFFYRHIYKKARLASIILFCMQMSYVVFLSFQQPEMWKNKSPLPTTPADEIFEFSSNQNIIHIILDEFQSTVFQEIIDQDPDYYKELDGFTFFKETSGSFPTTLLSIPAILTGQTYKNDMLLIDFIGKAYRGKSITNLLHSLDYEIDFAVLSQGWYRWGRHSNYFYITIPYGMTKYHQGLASAGLMLNTTLFRGAPHFLKKWVHGLKWLSISDIENKNKIGYQGARHFAHKAFLQDLIDKMSVKRDKTVYKLIHLTTTHYPMLLNENCEYAGKILPFAWKNIKVQDKCCFDEFMPLLRRLKSLGIYESSLIILQADHGYWKVPNSANELELQNRNTQIDGDITLDDEQFAKIVCSALPLLAIKPPYCEGPLKISSAHTALTDIPDTICSILGVNEKFGGRSVFHIKPTEQRERRFVYYEHLDRNSKGENRKGSDYFGGMYEYVIKGSMFDKSSWHFVRAYSPEALYRTKKIDFGTPGASRFLRSGWSGNERVSKGELTYSWGLGNSASVFLAFPKNKSVFLTANVRTLQFTKPQHVTIKVDNKEIGNWELSSKSIWEKHSVLVEPDPNRPDVSVVEFIFSQCKSPPNDPRKLAVLFESLTLEEH